MFQGFFKSVKNKSLLGLSLLGLSTLAFAEGHSAQVLQSSDFVGITFWLISMALVASTAFFFLLIFVDVFDFFVESVGGIDDVIYIVIIPTH